MNLTETLGIVLIAHSNLFVLLLYYKVEPKLKKRYLLICRLHLMKTNEVVLPQVCLRVVVGIGVCQLVGK